MRAKGSPSRLQVKGLRRVGKGERRERKGEREGGKEMGKGGGGERFYSLLEC